MCGSYCISLPFGSHKNQNPIYFILTYCSIPKTWNTAWYSVLGQETLGWLTDGSLCMIQAVYIFLHQKYLRLVDHSWKSFINNIRTSLDL